MGPFVGIFREMSDSLRFWAVKLSSGEVKQGVQVISRPFCRVIMAVCRISRGVGIRCGGMFWADRVGQKRGIAGNRRVKKRAFRVRGMAQGIAGWRLSGGDLVESDQTPILFFYQECDKIVGLFK